MPDVWERFDAILAEIDRVPDLPESFDPLEWDKRGPAAVILDVRRRMG
jgi:hypothetical protein